MIWKIIDRISTYFEMSMLETVQHIYKAFISMAISSIFVKSMYDKVLRVMATDEVVTDTLLTAGIVVVLGILFCTNMFWGLVASKGRGEDFNGKKAFRGVVKFFITVLTFILLYVIDLLLYSLEASSYIEVPILYAILTLKLFLFFWLVLFELKSIGDNVEEFYGQPIPVLHIVDLVWERFDKFFLEKIKNYKNEKDY